MANRILLCHNCVLSKCMASPSNGISSPSIKEIIIANAIAAGAILASASAEANFDVTLRWKETPGPSQPTIASPSPES
jgi:hypothetical protein